jgi:hypothetical protein
LKEIVSDPNTSVSLETTVAGEVYLAGGVLLYKEKMLNRRKGCLICIDFRGMIKGRLLCDLVTRECTIYV